MKKLLTVAEIKDQFRSEWVLIEDPETDEALSVKRGKVRYHSKDRDEVYRQAAHLRPKRFAVVFTGTMSKDAAVVL